MVITLEFAQPILDKLTELLEYPVHIMDRTGIIVASTDSEKTGALHAAAVEAIRNRQPVYIDSTTVSNLPDACEGVALPLEFHGESIGAVGIDGRPDAVRDNAVILKAAMHSLLEQSYLLQQADHRRKVMDNWVNSLIQQDAPDHEQLWEQARYLGIDLKARCSIVLVQTKPASYTDFAVYEQYLHQIIQSFTQIQFYSYIDNGQYLFAVPAATREDVLSLQPMLETLLQKLHPIRQESCIGVGRPHHGISGYNHSYTDALSSIRITERLHSEKKIMYYFEHQIFRLLESVPGQVKQSFIDNYLDTADFEPVLLETLQVYFDQDRRIRETAEILQIHRNTLIFRLNKTKELYGLDPRSFHDSLILQVLLYMLSEPPPGSSTAERAREAGPAREPLFVSI